MSVTGIIVEYNPLHNGHIYHLEQTKKITDCNSVVAVMSGNFVQRGEPAFVNKWARTEMALLSGIDLVIELPTIYSLSSAEGFAFGAVSILSQLGIVDNICFGSESGDISALKSIAQILTDEPKEFKVLLQENLKSGISFPRARQIALTSYIINNKIENVNSDIIENILSNSNNILAIEYIKALNKLSCKIVPFTINRINNRYNDCDIQGSISSATSIRHNFADKQNIEKCMPDYCLERINTEIAEGRGPVTLENFSEMILYKLRSSSINYLNSLLDVGEGLEYKIKRASENSGNIAELISQIKNKRYTTTRIQRILLYALLGFTKELKDSIKSEPEYIRVLGFNKNGMSLLKKAKAICGIPIITNPSNAQSALLHNDIMATDTYVLAYSNSKYKFSKQDLKTPPVRIDAADISTL